MQGGDESPASEAKRAKLDNEKIPEVDETPLNEETKAEAWTFIVRSSYLYAIYIPKHIHDLTNF